MTHLEEIKDSIRRFPAKPGVYVMKDFDGVIIYVGKAKNLKNRVRSYFGTSDTRLQIQYLLKRVQVIDHIITETEEEAFLLERDLIHKHKPRYNVRLKDDKAFLSIRVDRNQKFPRLELVRRIIPDGAEYYGPFPNTSSLREVLEVIKRVAPLRTCADTVFRNRVRPCLEYEIKRCAGPCCIAVDREKYTEWLNQALQILEGKIEPTIESLSKEMDYAAQELRFEEAGALRDRITALQEFKNRGRESVSYDFTCDVFSLYREEAFAVVAILKTRDGKISEVETYDFRDVIMNDEELIGSVIDQYYEHGHEIPTEIIVPMQISEEEILKNYFLNEMKSETTFVVPKFGPKHRLIRICEINARQSFRTKFFSESKFEEISEKLMKRFSLKQAPRLIECFDISNLQGSDIVGAHVSFEDGIPYRSGYRRFTISFQDKPNDFEAMYEAVKRRLSREDKFPDLIIIDGGKAQLQKACQARDELGLKIDIISIAKMRVETGNRAEVFHKPERIFIDPESEPIPLDPADELTLFLQRIRDEVHRYVITFHRTKRGARVFKSVLDEISGVGPERKRRLLTHFGSTEAIAGAKVEEVARIGRMPSTLAEKILKVLR